MPNRTTVQNLRGLHERSPFEELPQKPPGREADMRKQPDHEEQTYRASGRLIGRAVAVASAREGADLAVSYLSEEQQDANETLRWVNEAKRKSLSLRGDVRDETYCREIVDRTTEAFGHLDMTHEKIEDRTAESCTPPNGAGAPIINTASVQAYQPKASLLAHASTKGALVTFTRALAQVAIGCRCG